jgi:hypothetical protein
MICFCLSCRGTRTEDNPIIASDTNHIGRSKLFHSSFEDSRVSLVAHQGGLKRFGVSLIQSNIHSQTFVTTRITGYTLAIVYSDTAGGFVFHRSQITTPQSACTAEKWRGTNDMKSRDVICSRIGSYCLGATY